MSVVDNEVVTGDGGLAASLLVDPPKKVKKQNPQKTVDQFWDKVLPPLRWPIR